MIIIHDGIRLSPEIKQVIGVLQGDSFLPSCFVFSLYPSAVLSNAQVCLYADDLVFYSSDSIDVQHGPAAFHGWCQNNLLTVNLEKTKTLKFWREGRLAHYDAFTYGQEVIQFCKIYEYLGKIIQTSMICTDSLLCHWMPKIFTYGICGNWQEDFRMKIAPVLTVRE